MKRVVITGMGAVTPIGNDVPTMWENMINGRHGIVPITNFDTTGFATTLAAEVKDFEPTLYIARKDAERYDPYAIFGVYFSSGIGGLTTLERAERTLTEKGPHRVPPFSVSGLISNSAAAFIAIKYHCLGSCLEAFTACAS